MGKEKLEVTNVLTPRLSHPPLPSPNFSLIFGLLFLAKPQTAVFLKTTVYIPVCTHYEVGGKCGGMEVTAGGGMVKVVLNSENV